MARPYTILSAACQTHCILRWIAGGRQGGGQGRSEEGWKVGGREQGEGGREGGSDNVRRARAGMVEGREG